MKKPIAMIWRFVRQPQRLIYGIELEADYLSFKRRYGSFLSKGCENADPNRKLIVLSFSDYVAQVKAEAMLAKALQLHGCTPVIITNSSCQSALKYYRLFGIEQFVFFDEFLDNKISRHAVKEAEAFFATPLTVQDIKNYEYHGTRLGAHLLRTITRTTYKGSIDLSDPDVRRALKSLMLQGMHNVEQAEVLLDRLQPEVIFTLHPLNLGEGDIYEVGLQRGINAIQWDDSAQKDDHWLFKRYTKETRDRSFFSLSDETWDQVRQMIWAEEHEATLMRELRGRYQTDTGFDNRRLQEGKKLKTKEEVQQQLGLDPRKKTAVVFSHIVWDVSFLHGVDLFDTYEEWLVETTRAACENPALNWIIKLHPANLYKLRGNKVAGEPTELVAIRKQIGELPSHVKFLHSDTDINTFSLFELTDYCLTVRGTIGIEMPCFGIPVFTAGTGRYSSRGFTIDSDSREEYLDKLRRIQDFPPLSPQQTELAKKHAYWLFTKRRVRLDGIQKVVRKDYIRYLGHPLASNFIFQFASQDDIVSNRCVDAFATWVLKSRQPDFLGDISDFPGGPEAVCQ
jgi:hypothetical protein